MVGYSRFSMPIAKNIQLSALFYNLVPNKLVMKKIICFLISALLLGTTSFGQGKESKKTKVKTEKKKSAAQTEATTEKQKADADKKPGEPRKTAAKIKKRAEPISILRKIM